MLYNYTPESVGGTIIYDMSGQFYVQQFRVNDQLICVYQNVKDDSITIKVFEKTKTVKVISTVELDFIKHERDDYYYPIKKGVEAE